MHSFQMSKQFGRYWNCAKEPAAAPLKSLEHDDPVCAVNSFWGNGE